MGKRRTNECRNHEKDKEGKHWISTKPVSDYKKGKSTYLEYQF